MTGTENQEQVCRYYGKCNVANCRFIDKEMPKGTFCPISRAIQAPIKFREKENGRARKRMGSRG